MFDGEREDLVQNLVRWGYLRSPHLIAAFRRVPRHEFVPKNMRKYAYSDQPLPVGHGQTISAPSMIAIMMESLEVDRNQRVLEIGTGSGYNAALLAEVVGSGGRVVSVERIRELADRASENLRKTGYGWVEVVVGDGTCGHEEGAPWDRILVTACAPRIPEPLIQQLAEGGRLGAPVGEHSLMQTWVVAGKRGGKVDVTEHGGCSFVPLIGRYGWPEEQL
ncbi:MAG: protein-L-isoaspartate(D-aspartate) O-methyltransferase [Candidatus Hadarchaeales archaeon]